MNKSKTKIIVGLSGGVDSAVTALLLKQQGYDVSGAFMQNWETDNDDPYCSAEQDLADAKAICQQLKIPFHVINFAKTYWQNVFQYCLDEFNAGRTPNPDIWCNKEIKFKVFLQHALNLGADYLATGHYAKQHEVNGKWQLLKADDSSKDQSYFLYTLGQHELQHSMFPLSELPKSKVREIAQHAGFVVADKKDSTGICFIGERKFKQFLSEFLLAQPGDMLDTDGNKLGTHDGLMFYTIGQRQGLQIGGRKDALQAPWYVVNKDISHNRLIVAQGSDHPSLYKSALTCSDLHWVSGNMPNFSNQITAKIRYRQVDQPCIISALSPQQLNVIFDTPQRAITPGQSVVFYDGEICLGGGTIDNFN